MFKKKITNKYGEVDLEGVKINKINDVSGKR